MRALLVTAGLFMLAGTAGAAISLPHTLARNATGPIEAVTQDGRDVAWVANGGTKCNSVHVLAPSGTSERTPQPATGSMTCHWDLSDGSIQLAFASGSSAALWTLHESGENPVDYVMTAQMGGSEQRVDRLAHASDGTGLWLGGLAGAGATLAYSFVDVEYVDKLGCASGGSCRKEIAGGGINLVSTDGRSTALPEAGPALQLATAAGKLAFIAAGRIGKGGTPLATAKLPIEVVDATDGTIVSEVAPDGYPVAIALSPSVLAVLWQQSQGEEVAWYDTESGKRLGAVSIPSGAAAQLAASDRLVVYRVGRLLRGVTLATGHVRTLATVAPTSLGLSLQAGQLAWVENFASAGRVRALTVG